MNTYPRLTLASGEDCTVPPLPAAADSKVTVWRDRRDVIGALSHTLDEERWLHVLGVASFKLELEENRVIAVPRLNASPEAIVDEFQRTVWPTILQLRGWEVLHASAVGTPRGVVAFCALSETGKSTLAYGLGRRGYPLWADDAVILEVLPQSVQSRPLPFHVRLRPASARYFGYSNDQVVEGRVRCEGQDQDGVLPLIALCLLEQAPSLPDEQVVTIEPAAPGEALMSVLEHAMYFSLEDRQRKRLMMQHYLTLITKVPVLRVRFRHGLAMLPTILDTIEQGILAPSCPACL